MSEYRTTFPTLTYLSVAWRGKRTKQSNSMREHSIDQAKGTDVDVGDGEGRWEGSEAVVHEHREKGVDGAASVEGLARLHENQDWLKLKGQPSAHHPSGDIDKWVGIAGAENKSTGNAHAGPAQISTVTADA